MKNFSRFSILAVVLWALAGTAVALDVPTIAYVTIVEGVECVEDAAMNFGVLAKSDGSVTINPETGAISNPNSIIFDGAAINPGEFTVTSCDGIVVALEVAASGVAVDGLTLGDFTASWDGGAVEDAVPATPSSHTMSGTTADLIVGATLTVVGADVVIANDVELGYTLTLTLP